MANKDKDLRQHLLKLLEGKGAHVDFETAVKKASVAVRGKRPRGAAHSPWEILEHMRIAQWDILDFSRNSKHISPKWPDEYWPESPTPPTQKPPGAKAVRAFRADHAAMCALVGR